MIARTSLGRWLGLALAWALPLAVAGCPPKRTGPRGFEEPPPDGTTITCPVSDQRCQKTPATPSAIYEMRTYYFCCDDCPKRFAETPERFADK